jgi:2,3-bisphosphoglycerate-independent phosphoglycerate mutase
MPSHYRGRGSFEAMGAGLPMEKGDVAFKCNFATVSKVTRRKHIQSNAR